MPRLYLGDRKCLGHSLMFRHLSPVVSAIDEGSLSAQETCSGTSTGRPTTTLGDVRGSLFALATPTHVVQPERGVCLHVSAHGPQPPTRVCYWRELGVVWPNPDLVLF
jgi:hypothetical protein